MPPRKKPTTEKLDAVIYARFSSHRQKEESIEQQVAECKEFAATNGYNITEIYADRAVTGKTDRRASFQRMMRDAERRKFSTVIAYKSNRIGRNMLQALGNEDKLAGFGVKVLYAKEEFGDTAAGRFALRTMMNVNQFYSENMAEDIRRGLIDNAMKCKVNNGSMPIGYKKGEDGRYAIDAPRAAVVREIFERFYHGDSFVDIANDLNGRGIKTSLGNRWGKNSFHSLLKNEAYIGIYKYAEVRIEDGMPQIIEKELFYKVQEKLKTKPNPQGRHRESGEYLLTGKLFCGYCKSFMVGVSGTGKLGKLHYYYICKNKRDDKSCKKKNVRRDEIERLVTEDVKSYVLKDDVMEWIADEYIKFQARLRTESQLCAEELELADVRKAIRNIMTAIEQGIITDTTKDRLLELESQKKRLETSILIGNQELPTFTKEQVLFWLESFKDGNVEDKNYQKKVINAFVESVYLYDDEIKILFGYTGDKRSISHKLKADVDIDAVSEIAECSFNLPSSPPKQQKSGLSSRFFVVFPIVSGGNGLYFSVFELQIR